jgi:hemerythrin superfamily protein
MNAIQLLTDDHKKVRALLKELEATTPRGVKTRTELLAKIAREIEAHTTIEEEIFYPAFKAAGQKGEDDRMFFEALEEHRAAGDLVLPDLLATDPASECFGGRAKVFKELIEHHAGEEEKEFFPRARVLLDKQQLAELGARMAQRKAELLADGGKQPKSAAGKLLTAVVDAISPSPAPEPAPRRAAPRKKATVRKAANGASAGRSRPSA